MKICSFTALDAPVIAYLQDDYDRLVAHKTRPAIIICAGGAYRWLSPREKDPVALHFAAMGWQTDAQLRQAEQSGIERTLFPDLSADEQRVVSTLERMGDAQLNALTVGTNFSIGQLTALLFQLEMKGVIRPLAGGVYHLLR
jgi:predicted Rossmann fold nucleotide-binding protein DprA/Smf involved in DNA uptake